MARKIFTKIIENMRMMNLSKWDQNYINEFFCIQRKGHEGGERLNVVPGTKWIKKCGSPVKKMKQMKKLLEHSKRTVQENTEG